MRVAIVDDHPIVHFGVKMAMQEIEECLVVAEAARVDQALEVVESHQPDLLVFDLLLNGRMETTLISRLKALCPTMRILVYSSSAEALFASDALRAGASGYLMKSDGLLELKNAVRAILAGEIYLSEKMKALRSSSGGATGEPAAPAPRLTPRETEIFQAFGRGMATAEIAKKLNLSIKTVAAHRDNLKVKLNVSTSTELMHKAITAANEIGGQAH